MNILPPVPLSGGDRPPTVLERRVDAAQAALDKFRDKPFQPGASDCVQMLISLFRQLGVMPKYGTPIRYRTLLGGRAVLRKLGHGSVEAWLDSFLPQITAAAALPGDVLELQAEEATDEKARGLGAFVIYLGNGAVAGYHEVAVGGCVMRLGDGVVPLRAWRTVA